MNHTFNFQCNKYIYIYKYVFLAKKKKKHKGKEEFLTVYGHL